ncbi:MAG: putative oxidoreductase C-terminal domain-containing protein [Ginsengibacter sp.]
MFKIKTCIAFIFFMSCNNNHPENSRSVQLFTLDPGHFHAALVQKTMYHDVDSTVHVYAPTGNDLRLHLDKINAYNKRGQNPTNWREEVYEGDDFFEKMISEKKANPNNEGGHDDVVVLSGNNQKKAAYILQSLQNGFNVLADKPMAIDRKGFEELKQAFAAAAKNNLLLYDIMTERFEITTIVMRELSMMPGIFGTLEKGTEENPAVVKESTHNFYKYVSGNVLTRPAWFFDVSKQGDGITDVMTHLVDLVQWECFPGEAIDFTKDIQIDAAKHWSTGLNLNKFKTLTLLDSFPSYLKNNITNDTLLNVFSNGEINYTLRDVHAKTSVIWEYESAEGGDTYHSMMRGTKASLEIKQGVEEKYKPTLYVKPVNDDPSYEKILKEKIKELQNKFPGIDLKKSGQGWEVIIPEKYKEGHEAHFARVTENFLSYLKNKNIPAWEVPCMLAKYYTTTSALDMALKNK